MLHAGIQSKHNYSVQKEQTSNAFQQILPMSLLSLQNEASDFTSADCNLFKVLLLGIFESVERPGCTFCCLYVLHILNEKVSCGLSFTETSCLSPHSYLSSVYSEPDVYYLFCALTIFVLFCLLNYLFFISLILWFPTVYFSPA